MNLGPGGKQHLMRQTTWVNGIHQELIFSEDHAIEKLRGKAKGIKLVLEERGLWRAGLTLDCRVKCSPTKLDCCARKIMANQPDFLHQKCMLEELIAGAGQMIIFYPKLHCELNFIESFWGSSKRYAQKHCNNSWSGLRGVVPKASDSVSLPEIRNYYQKSQRYMDVYRKGLSGKAAECAVKKYRSHRRVPNSVLMDMNCLTA